MSKELLKLFENVEKTFLYGTAGEYREQLKRQYIEPIKQALTPPTADEVAKALSEVLTPSSHHLKVTNKGISYEYDKDPAFPNETGIAWICQFDGETLAFGNYDLTPHLITMIGRFYESEAHK